MARRKQPLMHGRPWTQDDDIDLVWERTYGDETPSTYALIARLMWRTRDAVASRLKYLRKTGQIKKLLRKARGGK